MLWYYAPPDSSLRTPCSLAAAMVHPGCYVIQLYEDHDTRSTRVPNQDTIMFSGEGLLPGAHMASPGSVPDGVVLREVSGLVL